MPITDYDRKKKLSSTDLNDSGTTIDKAQPVEMAGSDFTGVDGFESGSSQLGWEANSNVTIDGNANVFGTNSLQINSSNQSVSVTQPLDTAVSSDGKIVTAYLKIDNQGSNGIDFTEIELLNGSGNLINNVNFPDGGSVNDANANTIISSWAAGTIYKIQFTLDFTNNQVDITVEEFSGTVSGTVNSSAFIADSSSLGELKLQNDTDGDGITRNAFFDRLTYTNASEDTVNAGGYIGYDSSTVSGPADVGWYDGGGNLRDYEIENSGDVGSSSSTFWMWGYGSRTRDGTVQDQIAYGNNSASEDRSQSGTGSNAWGNSSQGTLFAYHMGADFNDSSPNGRDGSFTGTTQTEQGVGPATGFDGSADKANASYSSSYPTSSSGTIVCHVEAREDISSNPNDVLFENGERINFDIRVGDVDNSGGYEFFVSDSGGNGAGVSSNITTQGEEFILVATHDGSSNTLEFYADGALQNSASSDGFALSEVPTSLSVAFSEADGNNSRHFDCEITELKAFSNYKDGVWAQAEYDATPKAGQVFFSQQAAETTGTTDQPGSIHQTNSSAVKQTTAAAIQKTEP